MKKHLYVLTGVALSLTLVSLHAQPGPRGRGGMMGGGRGPQITEAMSKLFGDNPNFTATLQLETKGLNDQTMTIPGRMVYDSGKSRFEMNLADIKGTPMPPEALERIKTMGLDRTTAISRPDKKVNYTVYPGLQAYLETAVEDSDAAKTKSDFKVETAELGKETVDGHACVKKKVTVTDDKGEKHEFNIWAANDLKGFPVKIENTQEANSGAMTFKDVKLGKPAASEFEPPSDYKKYESQQELQMEMMKRMGAGGGMGGPGGPPRGQ